MVWYKNYECLQRDVFPLEQQEDFFLKKIYLSVIQKYVMHTWGHLPLLPVFGTIFQKYTKIW